MSSFVVGATGYTGRAVVEALRERGEEVFAHVRPDSKALPLWKKRFQELGATMDTTPWVESALRARFEAIRPTIVFSLLGTTQKRARAEGLASAALGYEAVDYGLTVMLARALLAAKQDPHFVYLSSLGTRPDTRNVYLSVRARVEAFLEESQLVHTVVRPSFITGPDRDDARPFERVGAVLASGLLTLTPRRVRDQYRPISNQALARALVRIGHDRPDKRRIVEARDVQAFSRLTSP
jgi:uncharacterized protein YbjT (DUF2867 family)